MKESNLPVWRELQELAADTVRLQTSLLRTYGSVARAAARGDAPRPRQVFELVRDQSETYVRELTRLNLGYARALQDLAAGATERWHDVVAGRPARSGEPRRVAMFLDGPVGGTASGSFVVANTLDELARLSFLAQPLVDVTQASQAEGFLAPFTFEPDSVQLEPGEEAVVTVTLQLDDDLFGAYRTYRGEVRVLGGEGVVLDVTVNTLPAAPAPPTPGPTKTPPRAAKKAASAKAGPEKAGPAKKASPVTKSSSAAPRAGRARRTPPPPV